jgi:uncharacterized protein with NRDE domain
MCLVGLALDESRRFPFVVAANRDEFFARPANRLAWWTSSEGGPEILGGRDLSAGGTWMGLTAAGRFALVTNVRRPTTPDPEAPSRGEIVPGWLRTEMRPDQFWMQTSLSGYAPFNLIAADFRRGDCFWASNEQALPHRIERGIFGLSNAALDTPWPKVLALKGRMAEALKEAESVDMLADRLFEALADDAPAADAELPGTGIARDLERLLSPAFIRTPDGRYGTRCSTVVVTERVRRQLVTHVFERTFPQEAGGEALLRRARLADWPPRYADRSHLPVEVSAVAESALGVEMVPESAELAARRTRHRTLLRPARRTA